jgi:polyisoprenoid-binding protein YceI
MKIWIALAAAAALAACSQQPADKEDDIPAPVTVQAPSGEYALDPNHSTLGVRVPHFGLAHYQFRFNALSGAMSFNGENPAQSTVTITVDTTTLDTPYIGETDFDAQLQNSEWLDSATHPTATFTSTSVEQTGANTARVTGDLTIRGVTHPATFDVTYNGSWRQHPAGVPLSGVGFTARGTIQRSHSGVVPGLPPAGDPGSGIGDEIDLVFEAEFNRPLDQAPVPAGDGEPVN